MTACRSRVWPVLSATALGILVLAGCTAGTADDPRVTKPTPASSASPTAATPTSSPTPTSTVVPVGPPTSGSPATSAATPSSTPSPTPTPVDIFVTNSGWDDTARQLWVGGYVAGSEEGGVCTLTATNGGTIVTARQDAQPDVSTTTCGWVTVDRDRLATGTWTATLAYASLSRAGVSNPVIIEVP